MRAKQQSICVRRNITRFLFCSPHRSYRARARTKALLIVRIRRHTVLANGRARAEQIDGKDQQRPLVAGQLIGAINQRARAITGSFVSARASSGGGQKWTRSLFALARALLLLLQSMGRKWPASDQSHTRTSTASCGAHKKLRAVSIYTHTRVRTVWHATKVAFGGRRRRATHCVT